MKIFFFIQDFGKKKPVETGGNTIESVGDF